MKNTKEFLRRFLVDSDKTGRFVVKSKQTGRVYYVEALHNGGPSMWGDRDPVTQKMTGDYGQKYPGAIHEKDSLITQENGFDEISYVHQGSPFAEIDRRDEEYMKFIDAR